VIFPSGPSSTWHRHQSSGVSRLKIVTLPHICRSSSQCRLSVMTADPTLRPDLSRSQPCVLYTLTKPAKRRAFLDTSGFADRDDAAFRSHESQSVWDVLVEAERRWSSGGCGNKEVMIPRRRSIVLAFA
jgi:hypothetical protein